MITTVDAGHSAIGLNKELGIRQAGLEHPLIAAAHGGDRVRQTVTDAEKTGQQVGAGIQGQRITGRVPAIQRHVALMGAHHRAENFSRQRQVVLGDAALNQQGCLHQIGELLEQIVGQIGRGLQGSRRLLDAVADDGGPGGAIHLHSHSGERVGIGRSAGDDDRLILQAMAAADVAGCHRRIAAGQRHGNHLGIKQGHQPANGPREAAVAVPPAHETTPLQSRDPLGNDLNEQILCRATAFQHAGEHERALWGITDLESLRLNAAASGESHRCGSRAALLEGLRGGRPLAIVLQILGGGGETVHLNNQTPGSAGAGDLPMAQSGIRQVATHELLQLRQRKSGKVGRKLLCPDLQQKGGHAHRPRQRITVLKRSPAK